MAELLDLSKVNDQDTVTLPARSGGAGKSYPVINRAMLGLYELFKIDELQTRAGALTAKAEQNKSGKLTKKQESDLLDVLGEFVQTLIPTAPADIIALLPRGSRESIILAWLVRNFPED